MKKFSFILLFSSFLLYCTPKGPQTFPSPFIGKTKSALIEAKGPAQKTEQFENSHAVIYMQKEEYFGKGKDATSKEPKRVYSIEYIYYINDKNMVYKYQVWKKRVNN